MTSTARRIYLYDNSVPSVHRTTLHNLQSTNESITIDYANANADALPYKYQTNANLQLQSTRKTHHHNRLMPIPCHLYMCRTNANLQSTTRKNTASQKLCTVSKQTPVYNLQTSQIDMRHDKTPKPTATRTRTHEHKRRRWRTLPTSGFRRGWWRRQLSRATRRTAAFSWRGSGRLGSAGRRLPGELP